MARKSRKLKYEDVKHYIEVESESYCKLISTEYKGCKDKMDIQCGRCGEIYKVHWNHFKNNDKHQCNECSTRMSAERYKFSIEDVKHYVEVESNSGCKLLSNKYKNNRTNLNFRCACGNTFKTTFDEFKSTRRQPKQQCNECSTLLRLEKKNGELPTIIKFVEENSNCKLLSKTYKGQLEPMPFLCSCGEIFNTTISSFLHSNKKHCDRCGLENGFMSMRLTIEEVLQYIKNNSTSKLITKEYLNDHTEMKFECECGNIFKTTFDRFKRMNKRRCDTCGRANPHNRYTFDFVKNYVEVESNTGCKLISTEYVRGSDSLEVKCSCGREYTTTFACFKNANTTRCGVCSEAMSKGEVNILAFLEDNNIEFQVQKEFNNLTGLGGGLLSYDFYLSEQNLLIEYQGQQHGKYIPWFHEVKDNYHKQLEHDKRKKEYAQKHNIKLLEIWYYDFDNIESILNQELNLNSYKTQKTQQAQQLQIS